MAGAKEWTDLAWSLTRSRFGIGTLSRLATGEGEGLASRENHPPF